MKTLQELAQEALDVQDASNLSGIVHGWSRSISRLRELLPGAGTDKINRHPINQLWADKVAQLTGTQCFCKVEIYSKAYDVVKGLADGNAAATPPECP